MADIAGSEKVFSVITPVLNGERFVSDCLRTVEAAFGGFAYEHIIVDGGSRDGTVDAINAIANEHVTVISAPGSTMYEALNMGMRAGSSRIFYQINIDDIVLPEAPGIALQKFESNPDADVVIGACLLFDMHANCVRPKYCLSDQNHVRRLAVNQFVPQPSAFVRMKCLRVNSGYSEAYKYASDTELWLRLTASGVKFVLTSNFFSIDRIHSAAARLSAKHIAELGEIRERWGKGMQAHRSVRIRNRLDSALRNLKGLHLAEGGTGSVKYIGSTVARDLSLLFSKCASMRIETDVLKGTYPIRGYLEGQFNSVIEGSIRNSV